jgi:Tol biopolymer transport system component
MMRATLMPLAPGTRLGAYEILAPIGAGGMGEVYRAHDAKLNRDVAIKILPEAFATEPERLIRFRREAQVLASLNHQNIAHLYGFEDAGATHALVMEMVEGPTLADRIKQGLIALADALPIAHQIADALEAAHEQGIVHRDLKPANIKVRVDGTVKVLDFGLAKALDPYVGRPGVQAAAADPSSVRPAYDDAMNSPTLTARATQMGMILGTAAYMAPEQAKGKVVDKRADIWAFGVVLYEMLTGRRLFVADTIPETLAHVLTREVNLAALPAGTPPRVRRLIARCLVKDPRQRLRDIGDARLMIDERDEAQAVVAQGALASFPARLLIPTAIALGVIAVGALVMSLLTRSEPERPAAHLSIALPSGEQVTTAPAISADGRTIAYAAGRTRETSRLYLRAIDSFAVRAVDGSQGALSPFFSPDGRSVAFFASGKLWRAPVAGGAPSSVAPAPRPWGGTWCIDDTIVYVPNLYAGLWRVPAGGGTPVQLTKPDGATAGYAHAYPQRLPGTDEVLFSFWGRWFNAAVFSPKTGTWREATPRKPVGGAAAIGVYAENGYLLTGDGSAGVTAVDWTSSVTTLRSPETVVLDSVNWIAGNERAWFNVSANGTVVYSPGSPLRRRLVWVDRQGGVTPLPGDPDAINEAMVSPDGKRVVRHGKMSQWVEDLATGTRTRIVSDLLTWHGGWLPGGDRIVISSNKDGDWDLYSASANGNGDMKPLLKRPFGQHPMAVAHDGSVVYIETHPETGNDLWILAPDGRPRPLVVTPFNESAAAVSADGKYVAYVSDESGHNEVYVIPFSGTGERATVSTGGGTGPVWSRDGRELFYRTGDDLVSVDVRSTNPLVLGARRKLLDVSAFEPGYFHDFDVSADGQRFLFIRAEPDARPTRIDVIVNWFPELARLVHAAAHRP